MRPLVDSTFPLDAVAEAHRHIEGGEHRTVVLTVSSAMSACSVDSSDPAEVVGEPRIFSSAPRSGVVVAQVQQRVRHPGARWIFRVRARRIRW